MLLVATAALTTGSGSAALHGRQVVSTSPEDVSGAPEVGTPPTSAGNGKGASPTSLGARSAPAAPAESPAASPTVPPVASPPAPRVHVERVPPAPAAPAPPVSAAAVPSGGWQATTASFYGPRALTCWNPSGPVHVPQPGESGYDARYTAAHLPCGTVLEVTGPAGTVSLRVWDHGPNCSCPARAVDLSPAAFLAVVGSLSAGVATVRWRVAAGERPSPPTP